MAFYLFYVVFKFYAKDFPDFPGILWNIPQNKYKCNLSRRSRQHGQILFFLSFVNDNQHIFPIFFLSAEKSNIHMAIQESQTYVVITKKNAKLLLPHANGRH